MATKGIKRRVKTAIGRAKREIAVNAAEGGSFAAGLSAEGYAGGYRDALEAVQSLLNDVEPGDDRHYWRPLHGFKG